MKKKFGFVLFAAAVLFSLTLIFGCSNSSGGGSDGNVSSGTGSEQEAPSGGSGTSESGGEKTDSAPTYTLVTDFPDGTTVWSGSTSWECAPDASNWTASAGYITVPLEGLSAGDMILVTHYANESSAYYRGMKFSGYGQWEAGQFYYTDNSTINAYVSDVKVFIIPYTPTQTTGITLSAAQATQINESGGFTIWGAGYTVTKVVVVSSTLVPPSTVAENGWIVFITNQGNNTVSIFLCNDSDYNYGIQYYQAVLCQN